MGIMVSRPLLSSDEVGPLSRVSSVSRSGESLACTERITLFDDNFPFGSTDTKKSRAFRTEGFCTGGVDGFSAVPVASCTAEDSWAAGGFSAGRGCSFSSGAIVTWGAAGAGDAGGVVPRPFIRAKAARRDGCAANPTATTTAARHSQKRNPMPRWRAALVLSREALFLAIFFLL